MLDDFDKVVKLVEWFKSTELVGTDSQQLISFSTGEISTDDKINCAVGMQMQKSFDGQTFTSKVSLKSKCLNFNVLRKTVKINKKYVILAPYVLFQRMDVAAERDLKIRGSLGYELTIQPASLLDNEKFMRKARKYKLGQNLKNRVTSRDMDNNRNCGVVVDGGWLIRQITWQAGKLFSEIAQAYSDFLKCLACGRKFIIIIDGYNNSPKDHEHKRRTKNCNGDIQIILDPRKTYSVQG